MSLQAQVPDIKLRPYVAPVVGPKPEPKWQWPVYPPHGADPADVWVYLPRYKFPMEVPPRGKLFVRLETCVLHVWGPFLHHMMDPHYPHEQMRALRVHTNVGVNAFDGRGGLMDTCLATFTLGPDVNYVMDPTCPPAFRPLPPSEDLPTTILPFWKEYRDYVKEPLEAQCATLPPMLNVRFTDVYDNPVPEGLLVEWFVTLTFLFQPDSIEEGTGQRLDDETNLEAFLQSYLQG
jgi:hypothetical protein